MVANRTARKSELRYTGAFIATVFALSAVYEMWLSHHPEYTDSGFPLLMWIPGGCAIVWVIAFRFSVKDLALRSFRLKHFALAYGIPLAVGLAHFCLSLFFQIDSFSLNQQMIENYGGLRGFLISTFIISPFYYVLISACYALGEELCWRGFLRSRFQSLGISHPDVWIGLIWALWHWPMLLFLNYSSTSSPMISLPIFSVSVIGLSVVLGWIKDQSGSVFLPTLSHAVHNIWLQGIFPLFLVPGKWSSYLSGEEGLIVCVLYCLVAYYCLSLNKKRAFRVR